MNETSATDVATPSTIPEGRHAPGETGFDGNECKTPGCCTCDLPHCPVCGYTRHDAAHLMDHHLCKGAIPSDSPHPKGDWRVFNPGEIWVCPFCDRQRPCERKGSSIEIRCGSCKHEFGEAEWLRPAPTPPVSGGDRPGHADAAVAEAVRELNEGFDLIEQCVKVACEDDRKHGAGETRLDGCPTYLDIRLSHITDATREMREAMYVLEAALGAAQGDRGDGWRHDMENARRDETMLDLWIDGSRETDLNWKASGIVGWTDNVTTWSEKFPTAWRRVSDDRPAPPSDPRDANACALADALAREQADAAGESDAAFVERAARDLGDIYNAVGDAYDIDVARFLALARRSTPPDAPVAAGRDVTEAEVREALAIWRRYAPFMDGEIAMRKVLEATRTPAPADDAGGPSA